MTSWSISGEGVVSVLTSVQPYAESLGTAFQNVGTAVGAAATATASGAMGMALQNYFDYRGSTRIQNINTRIGAAVDGVVKATEAYIAGDLEMAAQSQSAAYALVHPPLPPAVGPGGAAVAV